MKLRNKLIMSGVALAACAATLTSTTYAWYTTNTQVTASGLSAGSASSGDSSILISQTGEAGTWVQNITNLSATGTPSLVPLMLNNGKLYAAASTVNESNEIVLAQSESNNGYFVEFDLFFKTSVTDKNVPIYLKSMTIANAAESQDDLTAWENLNNGKTDAGIASDATSYKKDIVDALAFTITTVDSETTYGDNESFQKLDGTTAYKPISTWVTSLGTEGEANDAHAYFNALDENKQLSSTISTDNSSAIDANTLICCLNKDGSTAQVTFRFYLNGSDVDCFDACKGQRFTLALAFSSVNS